MKKLFRRQLAKVLVFAMVLTCVGVNPGGIFGNDTVEAAATKSDNVTYSDENFLVIGSDYYSWATEEPSDYEAYIDVSVKRYYYNENQSGIQYCSHCENYVVPSRLKATTERRYFTNMYDALMCASYMNFDMYMDVNWTCPNSYCNNSYNKENLENHVESIHIVKSCSIQKNEAITSYTHNKHWYNCYDRDYNVPDLYIDSGVTFTIGNSASLEISGMNFTNNGTIKMNYGKGNIKFYDYSFFHDPDNYYSSHAQYFGAPLTNYSSYEYEDGIYSPVIYHALDGTEVRNTWKEQEGCSDCYIRTTTFTNNGTIYLSSTNLQTYYGKTTASDSVTGKNVSVTSRSVGTYNELAGTTYADYTSTTSLKGDLLSPNLIGKVSGSGRIYFMHGLDVLQATPKLDSYTVPSIHLGELYKNKISNYKFVNPYNKETISGTLVAADQTQRASETGRQTVSYIFTPDDTDNYTTATVDLDVNVENTTLSLTEKPSVKTAYVGQSLNEVEITPGICTNPYSNESVTGTWTWDDPDTVLTDEKKTYDVTFTPSDSYYPAVHTSIELAGTQNYGYDSATKTLTIQPRSVLDADTVYTKCSDAKSIVIAADVTDISGWDFGRFTSLESITAEKDNEVFASEDGILYSADKKTLIFCPVSHTDDPKLPSCETIGENAFKNSLLKKVTLPYSVTAIEKNAFAGSGKLVNLTVKNPACTVGENAIPATAESVTGFSNSAVASYCNANGIEYKTITVIPDNYFKGEESMTSFTVPDDVTDIGDGAFQDCTSLQTVDLNKVRTIGAYAFQNTKLQNVKIPASVTYIGMKAFMQTPELKDLQFAENSQLAAIGESTFAKSAIGEGKDAYTLTIPASVKNIGRGAFTGCSGIDKISFEGLNTNITWDDSLSTIPAETVFKCYYNSKAYDFAKTHDYKISLLAGYDDNTEVFAGDPDAVSLITEFEIGPNLKEIGDNALKDAVLLTEVTVPASVTKIGKNAFADSGVESLTIENPNCELPESSGLVPESAGITGYRNSTANDYSQKYLNTSCQSIGKTAYVIFLNANGGSGGMEKVYVPADEKLPAVSVPAREGYVFRGYYAEKNGKGTKYYDENGKGVVDSVDTGLTLYAAWEKSVTYSVAFDANGGTGTMDNVVMTAGTAANLPANAFRREGYVFTGWSADKDAAQADFGNKESVKDIAGVGETVTLYAVWTKTYTITYDANGGSGVMTPQTAWGKSVTLAGNAFTNDGKTFLGWAKSADAAKPDYFDAEKVNAETDENITLYAVWAGDDMIYYNIRYDANGGSMESETDSSPEDIGTTITETVPTRDGFIFAGWTDTKGSDNVLYEGGDRIVPDNNTTLYAVWTTAGDTEYTVTVNTMDENGEYPADDTEMLSRSADAGTELTLVPGVDFAVPDGYYVNEASSTLTQTIGEDAAFTIYLDRVKASVTYDKNAEDAVLDDIPVQTAIWGSYVTPSDTAPTREGYEFIGWTLTNDPDDIDVPSEIRMEKDGVTLYAKWKKLSEESDDPAEEKTTVTVTTAPTATPEEVPTATPTSDVTAAPTETPVVNVTEAPTKAPGNRNVTAAPTTAPTVTPNTTAKTKTVSGIVYKINGKTATVQKASSKKIKSAVIAAKVKIGRKTYKVTSISANAFKGCRKLAKVTIKSTSLKSIGRNAFKGIKKTAVFKTGKKKYKKYKKLIAKKTTGYTKKMKIKK